MPFMWNMCVVTFATVSAISSFRGRRHADVAPEMDLYWTYTKPELWPLSCKHGSQSPKEFLDFKTSIPETEKLLFQYRPIVNNVDIIHNTKSISLTLPEMHGGFGLGPIFANLTAESEVFGFWQLALHHPSEHLFGGKEVPVELQLYHTRVNSDTCRQAIVAIGFDIEHRTTDPFITGEPKSAFLETLSNVIPPRAGRSNTNGAVLDVSELFVEPLKDGTFVDASFVRYNGSNTIPPCDSADVFVRTVAVPASFKAVERIRDTLVGNARKREGAPVQTRLYASENCAGQTPPAVTIKSNEIPLARGPATQILCTDAAIIVEQFPILRLGPLSAEGKNPNQLILYCASVIAAMAEEEAMKIAYLKLKEEEISACERAVAKSAMVRESAASNDQQEQLEANILSVTCEEETNAAKAQKIIYDGVKDRRKKVDSAAKEQMLIAIGIARGADAALDAAAAPAGSNSTVVSAPAPAPAGTIEGINSAPSVGTDGATPLSAGAAEKVQMKRYLVPETPMVKDKNFKCNDGWPFGSAADTRSSENADGMVAKVVGDPRLALA